MFWSNRKRSPNLPKGCKDLADVLKAAEAKKSKKNRARKQKPLATNEQIRDVVHKYIPELANGTLEIVSTARVVGQRCLIVVRPTTANASSGRRISMTRGPQLSAMIDELAGEFPCFSFWDQSTEQFVRQSFSSPELQIAINSPAKSASVTLNMTIFEELYGERPKNTRDSFLRLHSEMAQLVSEVTGWKISIARA